TTIKATLVGITSLLALVLGCVSCPFFHFTGQWAVALVIVSYFLFSPAIVGPLYSIVFEKSELFGSAGLALAGITLLTQRDSWVLLDGLLLLPFYAFGAVVVVKLVKWRARKMKPDLALVGPAAGDNSPPASSDLSERLD